MKQDQQKVLLVAQEITFAKALSANEKSLRDRALRRLKKWLLSKSETRQKFSEEGFMRIWKGLFYCVWMSDKPLIQEDVVENISQLIHCFSDFNDARMFARCFFAAMSQAWFGLDQHRLDKFMMLVRRCVRQHFEYLSRLGWKKKQVSCYGDDLYKSLSMAPVGMILHISDLYLEELAKIGKGSLKPKTVVDFIRPFGKMMSESADSRVISSIVKCIFLYLLRQSELGIKFQTKFNAWKQMGFPGGDIDVLEEVDGEEENDCAEEAEEADGGEQGPLDPRAGSVHVYLPPIDFSPSQIVDLLKSLKPNKDTTTKGRRVLASLINKFSDLESGNYPLGLKKIKVPESEDEEEMIDEAALRLLEEEQRLDEDSDFEEINEDGGSGQHERAQKRRKRRITNKKRLKTDNKIEWEISDASTTDAVDTSPSSKVKSPSHCGDWEVTPISVADHQSPSFSGSNMRRQHHNNTQETPLNKNNAAPDDSWGLSEWDTPLKEGETEVFIPNKNYSKRRGSWVEKSSESTPVSSSSITGNSTPVQLKTLPSATNTPASAKKVAFVLNRNTAQEETEYKMALKEKPSIPYDANKKPAQGVLKPSAVVSPINPFYRHLVKPFTIK